MGERSRPRLRAASRLSRFVEMGVPAGADDDTRLRTTTLTLAASCVFVLAFGWTAVYLALGLPVAALIPVAYQVTTAIGLVVLARTKQLDPFLRVQLALMATLPFLLQLSLGGFVASSMVCLWALVASLGAAFVGTPATARRWFALFLAFLVVAGILEPVVRAWAAPIPDPIRTAFFVLNAGCVALTVFVLVTWALRERERSRAGLALERERSERLLRSILPVSIADRLKATPGPIAEAHEAVTVLFVDLVDFTPTAAGMPAADVVEGLDRLFALMDEIAERHGLEKIKTLGDAWLAVAGLPEPRPDHLAAALDAALTIRAAIPGSTIGGRPVGIRVGVANGPVVAGVIGRTKFSYDLWGDTVNQASRMQTLAEPGTIVTTRDVAERADGFRFSPRGRTEVKGLGTIETFTLEGRT